MSSACSTPRRAETGRIGPEARRPDGRSSQAGDDTRPAGQPAFAESSSNVLSGPLEKAPVSRRFFICNVGTLLWCPSSCRWIAVIQEDGRDARFEAPPIGAHVGAAGVRRREEALQVQDGQGVVCARGDQALVGVHCRGRRGPRSRSAGVAMAVSNDREAPGEAGA